jgi:hypothetical protein
MMKESEIRETSQTTELPARVWLLYKETMNLLIGSYFQVFISENTWCMLLGYLIQQHLYLGFQKL